MRPTKTISSRFVAAFFALLSNSAWADINFDGYTRFIFESSHKQLTFNVVNEANEAALVQVTLDWGENRNSAYVPMALSRPLLVIPANGKASVDILYEGTGLPDNQESFFLLSVLEVPKKPTEENVAQITLQHNLKLFYRPHLSESREEAVEKLRWTRANRDAPVQLQANNDSPYYLTLTEIGLLGAQGQHCGTPVNHLMVAPFSTFDLAIPDCTEPPSQLSYQVISDGGVAHPRKYDLSPKHANQQQ
ncbi:molecular chaperone [Pseudomonas sp. JM0905a]|uniref:fimbrial biogenesis chaperone n=1 Tax=Pseudomonas sp. JM0905a TaxID=2772484 RepID=UPI0016840F00|nr:molecular chaperone [Pseudomonas sp. JM0905a]MBD2837017.1 molecular chaperone [Pseudomonas sp. JM0905a]